MDTNPLRRRAAQARAEAWLAARARNAPRVSYPPELPITARADEIVAALRSPRRRVVIISGETGCGKSTQIPKMCLEAGRGIAGRIGCTQPRRIAAVTIAYRIAEELGRAARPLRRLQDPLPGPDLARRLHQDHDRRHPPRRDPGRPRPPRIRHDHHRRGPRALAQHRLPARHHAPPPRRAARAQADHHLGDPRHGEVLAGLPQRAGHRGQRPALSGRGRIPRARRRRRPRTRITSTRPSRPSSTSAARSRRATSSSSCRPSRTSSRRCRMLEGRKWPLVKVLPLFSRLPAGRAAPGLHRERARRSSWPRTSPRRR